MPTDTPPDTGIPYRRNLRAAARRIRRRELEERLEQHEKRKALKRAKPPVARRPRAAEARRLKSLLDLRRARFDREAVELDEVRDEIEDALRLGFTPGHLRLRVGADLWQILSAPSSGGAVSFHGVPVVQSAGAGLARWHLMALPEGQ